MKLIYESYLTQLKKILVQKKQEISDGEYPDIFPIVEIKYNPERYQGLIVKFDISQEDEILKYHKKCKKPKRITIKVFSSTKINIDGANALYSAKRIQNFLYTIINENHNTVLYKY